MARLAVAPRPDADRMLRRLGRMRLFHLPDAKFKTTALRVCLHVPLERETVTATALVPHVLARGCRGYPDLTAVGRRLEALYGTALGVGATKVGESHSLYFGLDVVAARYVPDGDVLPAALDLLGRLCLEPVLDAGGSFRADVVRQEQEQLAGRIRSIRGDKARYAAMRCVEAMCPDEPYGLPAHGRLEDLARLTPEDVTDRWRGVLRDAAVDVFAVGGGRDLEARLALVLDPLVAGPSRSVRTNPGPPPAAVRHVVEQDEVEQGKLCMGYRTTVRRGDALYAAMTVCNGILGGFPHSKLFRNVRERAGLAYYANTHWDALKGVVLLQCGIEPDRLDEALEIIGRQTEDMQRGRIDDDEMAFTQRGLADQLRAAADTPQALLDDMLGQAASGDMRTLEDRIRDIGAVTRADVVEAAAGLRLDTVYFLTGGAPGAGGR